MNLNRQCRVEELMALFADKNDLAGDHILWVGIDGEVHLDLVSSPHSPFEGASKMGQVQFRGGRWHAGNGFVGPDAAQNLSFMQSILSRLGHYWREQMSGTLEFF